jgi:hypothetical protein
MQNKTTLDFRVETVQGLLLKGKLQTRRDKPSYFSLTKSSYTMTMWDSSFMAKE